MKSKQPTPTHAMLKSMADRLESISETPLSSFAAAVEYGDVLGIWRKAGVRLLCGHYDSLVNRWQRTLDAIGDGFANGRSPAITMRGLARELRDSARLMEPTPTPAPAVNGKPATAHRRKKRKIVASDRKVYEAWETGRYGTYKQLAAERAKGETAADVEGIVGRVRKAIDWNK